MLKPPPRWPIVALALFCILATLSLLQGIADIVLPAIRGEPPFQFLFGMTDRFGPTFLIAYVFVHNLGLACLVPGYGFLAAYFEKSARNRRLIGVLLFGAVLASLLVAMHLIATVPGRFHLPTTAALLVGEACGVLALALAAAQELKGFVPTRTYEWSLVTPYRRLRIPLAYSMTVLILLSLFEAWAIFAA